ncbi:MAG: hypothetical protein HY443_02130 [Candidatus Nealsonbacteria bacterium]|nr:hypothetical protein [Candidatus Nealsonbacteria bacterium]
MHENTATLSQQDLEFIGELKEIGALEKIQPDFFDQSKGIILICCGDGDRSGEIIHFHEKLMAAQRTKPRVHLLSLNGGSLLVPACSPFIGLDEIPYDKLYRLQVAGAKKLKGMDTVVNHGHFPCGMASLINLDIRQVFELHKEADLQLQRDFPGFQIVSFMHIDYGEYMHSYHVSGLKWREFCQKHPRP